MMCTPLDGVQRSLVSREMRAEGMAAISHPRSHSTWSFRPQKTLALHLVVHGTRVCSCLDRSMFTVQSILLMYDH